MHSRKRFSHVYAFGARDGIPQIRLGVGGDGDDGAASSDSDCTNDENNGSSSTIAKPVEDSNVTKVPLHRSVGKTLDIYGSLPTNTTVVAANNTTDTNEVPHDTADGTHAMAWPAGIYLAKYLSSSSLSLLPSSSPLHNVIRCARTVVELGSGSGLGGLAFAATAISSSFVSSSVCLSSSKRKRGDDANKKKEEKLEVLLTDLPSAMNLLNYNIERNRDRLVSSSSSSLSSQIDNDDVVRAMPLVWGNKEDTNRVLSTLGSNNGVHLILGSDLLYKATAETLQALSTTIRAIDATNKATILLAVRWRKPEEERTFFRDMEDKGYEFRLVSPSPSRKEEGEEAGSSSRCSSTLGWREFGNPACNGSNRFFTESCVYVDGVQKALKDVSEADMDDMRDEEHDAFEQMFIQIYAGQYGNLNDESSK